MGDGIGPTSCSEVRHGRPSTRDGLLRGPNGGLFCPLCGEEVTDDDRPYVVTPEAAQAFLYCPYCGARLTDEWERVMEPSSRQPLMMVRCDKCKHVLLNYVEEFREKEENDA